MLEVKSCFSIDMDPYKAGIQIGESLRNIQPEILLLFPTIHYEGSPELVEGIYDAVGTKDLIIVGVTGSGFYERDKVAHAGVSALGINSSGTLKWHIAYEHGLRDTPYEATEKCLKDLQRSCQDGEPSLYYLVSDYRTDTNEIITALGKNTTNPVVGGLAGDDFAFGNTFIYVNHEVFTDTIAILGIEGSLDYSIFVAQNLQPIGNSGIITESEGTNILEINDLPAMDFIEQELGKPLDVVDEGTITFKVMDKPDTDKHRILSLFLPEDRKNNRSVKLFGSLKNKTYAQVCLAPPEKMIQDVIDINAKLPSLPFKPILGLIISCAGRKKVLIDQINQEVYEVIKGCPSLKALVGFPSFGEFGPVETPRGYSSPMFHNMTFILLLIGASQNDE